MALTAQNEDQIRVDIKSYIERNGGGYAAWYVGIAKDARERLFVEHDVHKDGDLWIRRQATSASAAREIEQYFLNVLGTDGGPGGGDQDSNSVYAYKKAHHTNP